MAVRWEGGGERKSNMYYVHTPVQWCYKDNTIAVEDGGGVGGEVSNMYYVHTPVLWCCKDNTMDVKGVEVGV